MRQRQRRRQIIALVVLVLIIFGIGFLMSQGGDDGTDVATGSDSDSGLGSAEDCPKPDEDVEQKLEFTEAPALALEDGKDYSAEVCTDVGTFTIDFDEDKAPKTVNNFVFLARNRFYDGAPFHRVIPDFVVQGGDAKNKDGTGDAGYKFEDELPEQGQYKVGSVAMANSGPNTNGSQFFVITGQQGVQLPPSYSLFGQVTKGMDVVKKIEADGAPDGKPKVEHRMVVVKIKTKNK